MATNNNNRNQRKQSPTLFTTYQEELEEVELDSPIPPSPLARSPPEAQQISTPARKVPTSSVAKSPLRQEPEVPRRNSRVLSADSSSPVKVEVGTPSEGSDDSSSESSDDSASEDYQDAQTKLREMDEEVEEDSSTSTSDFEEICSDEVIDPSARNGHRVRIDSAHFTLETVLVDGYFLVRNATSNLNYFSSPNHHVYRVLSQFRSQNGETTTVVVHHRFSDFRALHDKLAAIPDFALLIPQPPWKLPVRLTSEAAILERCRQLHQWITNLRNVRAVLQKERPREILFQFLTNGEDIEGRLEVTPENDSQPTVGETLKVLLDRGLTMIPAPSKDVSAVDDYNWLSAKLKELGEPARMYPWKKYVVTLFGPTSSGKSSLVNHLMTIPCTRSGDSQIDIGYTVFETLPGSEFTEMASSFGVANAGKHSRHHHKQTKPLTEEQLRAPLPETWEKVFTDPRYGKVFFISTDLERFRQKFGDRFPLIKQYNKVRSVFVNEDYLRGSPEDVELAKRLIVIDSKGLDQAAKELLAINSVEELEAKKVEIELMQLFNLLSDKILFLIPYHAVHNCTEQLATFELSIVCSFDNGGLMEEKISEVREAQVERQERERQQAFQNTPAGVGLSIMNMVLTPVLGFSFETVRSLGSYVYSSIGGTTDIRKKNKAAILGNEMWEKTRFIVTKIDEFYDNVQGDPQVAERQLFYSLGRAFSGRKYIEAPTFDRFIPIGLPERRLRSRSSLRPTGAAPSSELNDKRLTGDLLMFKASLLKEASDFSYDKRLDQAIVCMCEQLEALQKQKNTFLAHAERYWQDPTAARLRAFSRLKVYHGISSE